MTKGWSKPTELLSPRSISKKRSSLFLLIIITQKYKKHCTVHLFIDTFLSGALGKVYTKTVGVMVADGTR